MVHTPFGPQYSSSLESICFDAGCAPLVVTSNSFLLLGYSTLSRKDVLAIGTSLQYPAFGEFFREVPGVRENARHLAALSRSAGSVRLSNLYLLDHPLSWKTCHGMLDKHLFEVFDCFERPSLASSKRLNFQTGQCVSTCMSPEGRNYDMCQIQTRVAGEARL
jgi:hypothetical protein